MKNVLWLASWYPSELHPFAGDFIERHAIAASRHHSITVLYLIKDTRRLPGKKYHFEEKIYNANCQARILYYRPFSKIGWIESAFSALRYCIFYAEMVRQFIDDAGRPDLLHVHVGWKAGLIALYCKVRYKISYVLSEHWSGFAPGARPGFDDHSFVVRYLISRIYKRASKHSAVSVALGNALHERFRILSPEVIPNVVNTDVFTVASSKPERFRFIHVSEFNYQKNPEDLFAALALVRSKTTRSFFMTVFAPDQQKVRSLALKHGVDDLIEARQYVPQEVLALEISNSHALVLYSRFETFGCVVIEAMASGVPVIVSDLPVMRELVDEQTGVLVSPNDHRKLAGKMLWMIDNAAQFDSGVMAARAAGRFGFERVGRLFDDFYRT